MNLHAAIASLIKLYILLHFCMIFCDHIILLYTCWLKVTAQGDTNPSRV